MAEVPVRAAITMPGLRYGEDAMVDPTVPYIAEQLEAGYLIRLDGHGVPMTKAAQGDEDPLPDMEPDTVTEADDNAETDAVVPPDIVDAPEAGD